MNLLNLDELREKIDEINEQMVDLLCQRMELTTKVAEYKIKNNLPVYHPKREQEVIEKVSQKAKDEYKTHCRMLFTTIMDMSKVAQEQTIVMAGQKQQLYTTIEQALQARKDVKQNPKVAVCGIAGAYADQAAKTMLCDAQNVYCDSFDEVFESVKNGQADYGVLPIENSTAGSIHAVYDLIAKHKLYIIRDYKMPISHCLLANKGVELSQITDVYSHEQAISQCSEFLKQNPQINVHRFNNTATSAKLVAEKGGTIGAIASECCADLYGLDVVKADIKNAQENYTRFILISKELIIQNDANKVSLVLALPHISGSLNRLISRFSANELNMTKIESRPIPNTDFEFRFYFDFEGAVKNERVLCLLCALENELENFQFLGNY